MWFWPVNEMIELVSGMPAPQFEDVPAYPRLKATGLADSP
jgi:hypothetical protein